MRREPRSSRVGTRRVRGFAPHPSSEKQPPPLGSRTFAVAALVSLALLALAAAGLVISSDSSERNGVRTRREALIGIGRLAADNAVSNAGGDGAVDAADSTSPDAAAAGLRAVDAEDAAGSTPAAALLASPCPWSSLTDAHPPHSLFSWTVDGNLSQVPALEGTLRLHVRGCDLAMSVGRARQCLRRVGHVVFAGDSITRLQYINLVHFLHTGSWAPLDGGPPGDSPRHWAKPDANGEPSIDFPSYFRAVAGRLGGAEVCDCAIGAEHIENRFYDDTRGVRLSYVSVFKSIIDVVIHDPAWLNVSGAQAGCSPGSCDTSADERTLRLPMATALAALPRLLEPDVLIANVGVHEAPEDRESPAAVARVRALAEAMATATASGVQRVGDLATAWQREKGGAVFAAPAPALSTAPSSDGIARGLIWKHTTPGKQEAIDAARALPADLAISLNSMLTLPGPWPRRETAIASAVVGAGARVFDTHAILVPLVTALAALGRAEGPFAHSIDTWHFSPAVNAELNKALLAMLCEGV